MRLLERDELITNHYLANYNKLVKTSQRRVPDHSLALAEEVVQEAYARALKYFVTFNPKINSFDVWFKKILRNATNDCRFTEQERGVTYQLDENIEDVSVTKEEKKQYIDILYIIYNTYNNRDKEILLLFFLYNYTSKDISEYTGIKDTTIRQIILRFRNKIRDDLS